jgi:hypothetical protein
MTPEKLTRELAATRAKIDGLKADDRAVVAAPDDPNEIREYWGTRFAAEAAGRARGLAHHLAARRDGQPLSVPAPAAGEPLDLLPALAALLGADHLIELLAPHFAALPAGLTHAERRRKRAEIASALLQAEHREMDLIEEMGACGVPFTWRADQSPSVVLRLKAPA